MNNAVFVFMMCLWAAVVTELVIQLRRLDKFNDKLLECLRDCAITALQGLNEANEELENLQDEKVEIPTKEER